MHTMAMAPEVYVSEHFDRAVVEATEAAGFTLPNDEVTLRITIGARQGDDLVVTTDRPDIVDDIVDRVTNYENGE